jgi:conjugal transfer/entry exclusion protein
MAYKEKKRIAEQNMQTLERCVGDINNLKDDIAEIKALLSRLISKIN